MAATSLNINLIDKRMYRESEAAEYTGVPHKSFRVFCPVQPVRMADGFIWGERGKTQTDLAVPVSDELRSILDQLPPHDAETLLASTRGQSWTYNGFSTVWDRFKRPLQEKGLIGPGLTLKGLRHRIATELRESGVDTRAIADILGQKTESMPRWYSRDAVLAGKNMRTFTYLEGPEAKAVRASKVVKLEGKSVKPDPKTR